MSHDSTDLFEDMVDRCSNLVLVFDKLALKVFKLSNDQIGEEVGVVHLRNWKFSPPELSLNIFYTIYNFPFEASGFCTPAMVLSTSRDDTFFPVRFASFIFWVGWGDHYFFNFDLFSGTDECIDNICSFNWDIKF